VVDAVAPHRTSEQGREFPGWGGGWGWGLIERGWRPMLVMVDSSAMDRER
jgi:hypothetical protein